jgi:uncharacterized damage-inducible protein DinB
MVTDDLHALFDAVNDALFEAVTGLSDEQFRRRPGGGQWSIVEVLAHLAGERRRVLATLVRTLAGEKAAIDPLSDEERAQQAVIGRRVPPPQVLHDLIGSHRAIHTAIEAAAQAGTVTAAAPRILGGLVEHEVEHLAQIWAVRATVSETIALIEQQAPAPGSSRTILADSSLKPKG